MFCPEFKLWRVKMSIVLKDEVSGKPVEIQDPLLPEHVKVGRLLWYSGITSTSSWDCPAVITQVNLERKFFRVRSLDDMIEQREEYPFENDSEYADSRGSMRLATSEEVRAYVAYQREHLEARVAHSKTSVDRCERALTQFDEVLATFEI